MSKLHRALQISCAFAIEKNRPPAAIALLKSGALRRLGEDFSVDGVQPIFDRSDVALDDLVRTRLAAADAEAAQGRAGVPLARHIESELADYLDRVDDATVMNDKKLDEGVRRIVRQVSMEEVGKKPEVKVIISRLAAD